MFRFDNSAAAFDERAFENVLELAHVAGKG